MSQSAENDFLRSQLESAKASLAQAQAEAEFLKNRLILEQIDRAFEKAGGNPEIEPDQVRGMLGMFGDVGLVGGEAGFRRMGEKEFALLKEGMEILKRNSTLAPMFAANAAAPEDRIFKNEFGSFRKI